MSYIAPSSKVTILRNVPFDNSYRHSTKFASETAQKTYFESKKKYAYTNCSYLRKERVIRVEILADNLYDCNYIMFQNPSFGEKWFYAFITNVEYINNEMSSISYELDVLQTWQFDYEIKPSFVEREHSLTDVIGGNLVPENLELGEYITNSVERSQQFNTYHIVVASTTDGQGNNGVGQAVGRSYSGLYFNAFETVDETNAYIELLTTTNKADAIVSIFMMPSKFITLLGFGVEKISISKSVTSINGYTPRNKKLLTYPYNFLHVSNLMGNYMDARYEFFNSDDCGFGIYCDLSCNPTAVMFPNWYKGVEYNRNEKMVLEGFPQCAYATDTYKMWLAQNSTSSTLAVMGSAMAVGVGAVTGNPVAVVGGVLGIASQVAQVSKTQSQPPQSHGATGSNTLFTTGEHDFYFMKMSITKEFALIIDEYFDMHGYSTNRVKKPNINTRPFWNYVKTIGANVIGSIPTNDLVKIESILNNGITFWKSPNNVGDYTLNNSV